MTDDHAAAHAVVIARSSDNATRERVERKHSYTASHAERSAAPGNSAGWRGTQSKHLQYPAGSSGGILRLLGPFPRLRNQSGQYAHLRANCSRAPSRALLRQIKVRRTDLLS